MTLQEEIIQYIADNTLAREQVKNVTLEQLCTTFGQHSKVEFENVMRPIFDNMQRAINNSKLGQFEALAKQWILDNVDDSENVEFEFQHRERRLVIHLDGIPIGEGG